MKYDPMTTQDVLIVLAMLALVILAGSIAP